MIGQENDSDENSDPITRKCDAAMWEKTLAGQAACTFIARLIVTNISCAANFLYTFTYIIVFALCAYSIKGKQILLIRIGVWAVSIIPSIRTIIHRKEH